MKWEAVKTCNFCGGQSATRYPAGEVESWCDGRPLRLMECDDCGLVRAAPRPLRHDLFRRQLDGDISVIGPLLRQLSRPDIGALHRRAIEQAVAAAERPVRTLYDMGCGAGTMMMEASRLGIEAHGNDVNKPAIEMLGELGFAARQGFTQELDFSGAKFDAVMSLNYLGQSYEPFDELKLCRAILEDGGVIFILTPYLDCPTHRAKGAAWFAFGNENVHYFHCETLAAMIETAGFRIVDEERSGRLSVVAVTS